MALTNAERCRRWRQRHPDRFKKAVKKWQEGNPEKYREGNARASKRRYWENPEKGRQQSRARVAVSRALKLGTLRKPRTCSWCGKKGPVQAHHEDYDKPLDVIWFCAMCHHHHHRGTLASDCN